MYTTLNDITIEDLKKKCTHIHYFGLGFIQIKLGATYRLHVYTDLLPPIVDKEDIHDHRYDFTSTILYGSFSQELFEIVPGNTHILEEEACREDYIPNKETSYTCGVKNISTQYFTKGSVYSITHDTFHRVSANTCITLLKRGDYCKELARIVRSPNSNNVCPFSKKIPQEELWSIVGSVLEKAQSEENKTPK